MPEKGKRKKKPKSQVVGFVGIGLDNRDGHHRLTQGENFILVGGSKKTHDRMTDIAVQVNESLRDSGKELDDASPEEIIELFRDAEE